VSYDGGWEGFLLTSLRQLRGVKVADAFPRLQLGQRLFPGDKAGRGYAVPALDGRQQCVALLRGGGGSEIDGQYRRRARAPRERSQIGQQRLGGQRQRQGCCQRDHR